MNKFSQWINKWTNSVNELTIDRFIFELTIDELTNKINWWKSWKDLSWIYCLQLPPAINLQCFIGLLYFSKVDKCDVKSHLHNVTGRNLTGLFLTGRLPWPQTNVNELTCKPYCSENLLLLLISILPRINSYWLTFLVSLLAVKFLILFVIQSLICLNGLAS